MMLLAPPIGTEGEGGEGTQPFPAPSAGSARIRLGSVEVALAQPSGSSWPTATASTRSWAEAGWVPSGWPTTGS